MSTGSGHGGTNVEKFKLDRKIFSGWKIKKQLLRGIRTHALTRITLKSSPLYHLKFSGQKKTKKLIILKKTSKIWQK